jgi:EAL domain-containing protein (putative c-di-GMP-specific phosphodiesterase class I)
MASGALCLYYQPIRDVASGRVSALEVLLRWQDDELGVVSPGEFVPVAEASGMIGELGEWVLQKAAVQCRAWREAGYRPIRLDVNISPHQVSASLASTVRRILRESDVSPAEFELEITESAAMSEDGSTEQVLEQLKDSGLGLALDDFGTGYSSLSRLSQLPFDRLKIDRSFIAALSSGKEAAAVPAAIISLSHDLGLKVVAEGVETAEQMRFLSKRGCDEVQGYLFGRPVPAEECARFLEIEEKS